MQDLRQQFLPVTLVCALILTAGGGAVTATWASAQWKAGLDTNTEAVKRLNDAVSQLGDKLMQTWTKADHERWVATFHVLNPSIPLPP